MMKVLTYVCEKALLKKYELSDYISTSGYEGTVYCKQNKYF